MNEALMVGDVRVQSGQKDVRVIDLLIGRKKVAIPVVAINGKQGGSRVAITAGVHGAEYVGIEAARRLGGEIDPAQVRGSLVIVPIVNTTSFHRRAIYTSGLDEKNLNRMFPGKPDGTPSEVLANWIFENIIRPSDYYIDLHGGDMIEALIPFAIYLGTDDKQVERASLEMAKATGIERIIRGNTPGSTYAAATAIGIPAVLAEIGGQGVWSDDLVEQHKEGALNVLLHLKVLPGDPRRHENQNMYETFAWMRAEQDGLFHPTVGIGEYVTEGQAIGCITDYFGNEVQNLAAVTRGEIVFLVTSLAMNAGDPLLAIGV
ncbi:MAG: N(2)-acetyl-L-2,4-diaminobutanoate deacetylase DoeB [Chloroflexota bacterium]